MQQKRIMVVDDNEAIHYDFRKALEINKKNNSALHELRNKVFSDSSIVNASTSFPSFIIDSAYQGLEAIELVKKSVEKQDPYALAFIDMLMPPGIDGVTTIEKLWEIDPDLQIVICTAHSDYSYEEMYQRLKGSDNFLILKKPFDIIEILQLVSSLTRKWELDKQARQQLKRQSEQINYYFKEADFLYRLSQLSQTEFSTKEALQFYINEICSLRDWSIGHIYRAEREEDETVSLHSTDIWYVRDKNQFKKYQNEVKKTVLKAGEGLAGKILETKAAYLIEDLSLDPELTHTQTLISNGIKGALIIPIKLYDTVIAVVEFFSLKAIHSNQQLSDLTLAAANQLGLLLERRRNEKELKENYKKLQALYTEMQNTQAQLLQHAKLVSIGQLAAGVAHEINNPIAFIKSNTETLNQYIKSYRELFEYLNNVFSQLDLSTQKQWKTLVEQKNLGFIITESEEIIKESLEGLERVGSIVSDLKSFSHTDEAEIQEADIHHCIDVTLKIIWNELKYKCLIIKDYGDIPPLRCYPRQLNQVLMNLLVNASQAIAHQGEIKITTRCIDEAIHISIKDTGEGISPENIEKLYDPFFTTKPIGTGTGLGLSISYNIIKKHSGKIKVESEVGKGTTFTIILPLTGV
ncbi:ATP-binding protein [Legionella sp. km772]|uniref:ATP-binding protein n=1 Tax=Legionella sp. km772 TaxID=2498111 RepID=UPI000F8F2F80|nr:ATP-binding protein [Legionella sp. km772]RUR11626.1 response regulator [Legionella sp. km772]